MGGKRCLRSTSSFPPTSAASCGSASQLGRRATRTLLISCLQQRQDRRQHKHHGHAACHLAVLTPMCLCTLHCPARTVLSLTPSPTHLSFAWRPGSSDQPSNKSSRSLSTAPVPTAASQSKTQLEFDTPQARKTRLLACTVLGHKGRCGNKVVGKYEGSIANCVYL